MNKQEFTDKLRLYLADADSKIWQDSELGEFLDEALKQYCTDACVFTGVFKFLPDENGNYFFPSDWLGFKAAWNEKSDTLTPATGRELFYLMQNSSNTAGSAQYIYDDQCDNGGFSLYPKPPDNQNVKSLIADKSFGEVFSGDFGVFLSNDFGTTLSLSSFNYSGEIYYIKLGTFEEITDYMAVIYYALSIAYSTDTELANADTAEFWKRMYRERLNAFSRIVYNNTGNTAAGNFF